MDELHRILIAYEMRKKKRKSITEGRRFQRIKEDKRTQII
jgi:hypothetical protein